MRILFIAPYVPSLTRVRPFNLIKQLAARGHRITLCAAATAGNGSTDAAALRPHCEAVEIVRVPRAGSWWNCLRAMPAGLPLQAMYGYSRALRARVEHLLARRGAAAFDVVHIEHLRAALLGWSVQRPHVFDAVDCISQLFQQSATLGSTWSSRWSARLDLPRTRVFERRLIERFRRILATSADERAALLALAGESHAAERISVLPNGVDLEYFRPDAAARDPATLVFVGRMSYHANRSAVEYLVQQILPQVWRARPAVRLRIVGEDPPAALRRAAADSGGRIEVTGTVADVRPFVAQATLAVCPVTYAVGMQNKVLEAMAMATPTICTPAGARALAVSDGRELCIASDAASFASRIVTLLDDASGRRALGLAARQYVERAHDWRASARQLEAIYREEIDRQRLSDE